MIYKSKISQLIYFYWLMIAILIFIIALHIEENPYGLSFLIFLLLLPLILNPISRIIVYEDNIKIIQKYGFIFSTGKTYKFSDIHNFKFEKIRFSIKTGSVVLQRDLYFSTIFNLITGVFFYQPTTELSLLNSRQQCTDYYRLNIRYSDIEKIRKLIKIKKSGLTL